MELGEYGLELLSADNGSSSERTHLLISESLVVAPGSASELGQQGIDTGSQSLTLQAAATLDSSVLHSSGGVVTLQEVVTLTNGSMDVTGGTVVFASGGSVSDLMLDNSTLVLNQDLTIT